MRRSDRGSPGEAASASAPRRARTDKPAICGFDTLVSTWKQSAATLRAEGVGRNNNRAGARAGSGPPMTKRPPSARRARLRRRQQLVWEDAMKFTNRLLWLLATSALWCGAAGAGAAQAQTAAGSRSEGTQLETVVVTARRMEERLQDVPISITVFNQQQLENRNIVSTVDLATYTPSLSVNQQFGPDKASFSIRGFVQDLGTAPSVGVYFADVVAPRANGPTTSGNGAVPGTMWDLANVQVLKGPQGTLFGRNTTGGAILLVPQKPTDKYEGYAEISAGDYGMQRYQGVINLPLGDKVRLRLGADRMAQDGYIINRSGIGPRDFNNINYWAYRASLVVDLTPTLENYLIATVNRVDDHGTLPRMIACARNPALRSGAQIFVADAACNQVDRQAARGDGFYDGESNLPDPFEEIRQWQVINTTTWKASDNLTIKNIASYGEYRERTRFNLEGDNLFVPSALQLSVGGRRLAIPTGPLAGQPFGFVNVAPGPTGWQAAQSTWTEELQLQGRALDGRLIWQAGGYAELSGPLGASTQFASILINCPNPAAFQCSDPLGALAGGLAGGRPITFGQVSLNDLRTKYRTLAGYAQATYNFTEQWSLTGGVRYTSDWIRGLADNVVTRYPTPNNPTFVCTKFATISLPNLQDRLACSEDIVQQSSKPTWLIDLDYKPTPDTLFYAKYSRGYRQGLVNLVPTGRQFETAGPESVNAYEIGAKTSYHGVVPATFNVALFYNDFSNQQLQANLVAKPGQGVGGNVLLNAGKSTIKGAEIEASVRPVRDAELNVSYAYLDTRLDSINLPTLGPTDIYSAIIPTAVVGKPLALSPRNRVTVTGTYHLPVEETLGRLSVSATFTHTDKQIASHADDAFVAQIGFNPGILPATNLLNLNFNWNDIAGRPVDLSLFVTNLTNQKYWVNMANAFASTGYESIMLGQPRMYGARVRLRFGS
jgi:iron complex outermembrane receptor protein